MHDPAAGGGGGGAADAADAKAWPAVARALRLCFVAEVAGMAAYGGALGVGLLHVSADTQLTASIVFAILALGAAGLRIAGLVGLRQTPPRSGAFGRGSRALWFTIGAVALALLNAGLVMSLPDGSGYERPPSAFLIAFASILPFAQAALTLAAYASIVSSLGMLGAYLGDEDARRRASQATTLLIALAAGAFTAGFVGSGAALPVQIVVGGLGLAFAFLYLWLLWRLAMRARRFDVSADAF